MGLAELFSTPQGAVAQCLGFVAMGFALVLYTFRERKKILFTKMIADALWIGHYLLLGGTTGAAINVVNVAREWVFYNKEKPWAAHLFWPICFVCLNSSLTLLSWQGWVSLLPLLGSSLNVIGLWCTDTIKLRLISIPSILFWLIYSILTTSISSTVVNVISLCSILYSFVRDFVCARREKREDSSQKCA